MLVCSWWGRRRKVIITLRNLFYSFPKNKNWKEYIGSTCLVLFSASNTWNWPQKPCIILACGLSQLLSFVTQQWAVSLNWQVFIISLLRLDALWWQGIKGSSEVKDDIHVGLAFPCYRALMMVLHLKDCVLGFQYICMYWNHMQKL